MTETIERRRKPEMTLGPNAIGSSRSVRSTPACLAA